MIPFADQAGDIPGWLLFVFGGAGGGALGTASAFLLKILDRKKADDKERKAEEEKDEETALGRLQKVMELREADCNKRIAELTHRVEDLERNRDVKQMERDAIRDKVVIYSARVRYLELLLRRAGVSPDEWDMMPPDTDSDLPAINVSPRKEDR